MQVPPAPDSAPSPASSRAETDYDRLFNLSLDLLCIAGLDGYFKRVNPSWTRVLGWSEAELLARPVEAFMHPEDRERTLRARDALAHGVPLRGLENRYLCKDGSYRWLAWQSVADTGASLVFAVARDITEHRQLEQERLVMSKLESTSILAGGIAHDFNNLLASLLLNLDMLNLSGPTNTEQKHYLQQAHETIQSARALTQQLILFAEGDVSARRPLRLDDLLQRTLEFTLRGAELKAECHIAPDLWAAEVDETQFAQALRGLLLNAREATPRGGHVRLIAENTVVAAGERGDLQPGEYVRLTIADDGAGIAPEVLPKIFDPYFSTKQRGVQKGMGLGLTMCRSVIHRHGGAISVESQPGRGTTVVCHLPASRQIPAAPEQPRPADTPATSRILVMDDEEIFREIMGRTLRQFGYQVTLAEHGDEAVALYERAAAEKQPFSLVLLDLTVRGGMGGSQTMKALQARDPSVRAVLMTGYSNEEIFRNHARHGFKAALGKPFSAQSLHAIVQETLGPRRARSAGAS